MLKSRILFVLCSALAAFSANAATFCVKPPPNNAPCEATIQAAVNMANAPGDTVKVAAGVYEETVTLGAAQTGITLMGAGATKTIIDTGELATRALNVTANGVTVIGLGIRNSSPAETDAVLVAGDSFNFVKSEIANVRDGNCLDVTGIWGRVEGSVFRSCQGGDTAIAVSGGGERILKNRFINSDGGVVIVGDGAVIEGNICEFTDGDGCAVVTGHFAQVRKNRFIMTTTGFDIAGNDALVEMNTFRSSFNLAGEVAGNNAVVQRNTAVAGGAGIAVSGDNFSIVRNSITDMNSELTFGAACTVCTNAVISDNKSLRNLIDFALFANGPGARIVNNKTARSFQGLRVDGSGAVHIENNSFTSLGGSESDFPAVFIQGSGVKTLIKNKVTRAGGAGFVIEGVNAMVVPHVLTGNEASYTGQSGFFLDANTDGVTLTGNKATNSLEEGFDNRGDNNTFSLNTAKKNRPGSDYCDEGAGTAPAFAMLPGDNLFGSFTNDCIGEP